MAYREPLSRSNTISSNSSNDDLSSLPDNPTHHYITPNYTSNHDLISLINNPTLHYISQTKCIKPTYNINEINLNKYHVIDYQNIHDIYNHIFDIDLFLSEDPFLHCGNIIMNDNYELYFKTNYLDTNGNRIQLKLNNKHTLYINSFIYNTIMDNRRSSSSPAAGGKKRSISKM